jgi:hypothetical protein
MHPDALHDKQIQPDAKIQGRDNVSQRDFILTAPGQPEHEKYCVDVSHPRRTGLCYTTLKSNQM